jgi:drug/metabolite transporter (DMT)-like permease
VFVLRRLVERIGSAGAVSFHSLFAAVGLVPVALAFGGAAVLTAHDLGLIIAGSVIAGAGAGLLFNFGLARIGSARTAVLTFAEPLVAVAIGALVWDEPLHPLAALGGAMVLGAGVHVARKAR